MAIFLHDQKSQDEYLDILKWKEFLRSAFWSAPLNVILGWRITTILIHRYMESNILRNFGFYIFMNQGSYYFPTIFNV